jgi:YidC/Oxa1 family membrane protein insertase
MHSEDTRNLLLAIAIVVAMLVGYQIFLAPKVTPEPATRTQQNLEAEGKEPAPGSKSQPDTEAPMPIEKRDVALERSQRIAISTPRLSGSIRVKGGRLDDLTLLNYAQTIEKGSPPVILLSPNGTEAPYYVDLGWSGGVPVPGADTEWQTDATELTPDSPVTLTWDNGQGLLFSRTYSIDGNYMVTVEDSVRNTGSQPVALSPQGAVNRIGAHESNYSSMVVHEGMVGVFNRDLQHANYDDIKEDWIDQAEEARSRGQSASNAVEAFNSTGGWLGITDKYWLVALIPDQQESFRGTFDYTHSRGRDIYRSTTSRSPVTISPGETATAKTMLFAGAKETQLIDRYEEAYGIAMFDRAIDWGWFYFLARPVFWLLEYIKGLVGNFGLAILAITVLIKLAFFSLANKSYIAMGKMRKLTPKIQALRERYKEDPQKQREEMMKLYQTEKVNPVAGCLPILVQIPVFIALYQVLMVSIEMRHAPFYGWVKDLSGQDPLLVTNLFGLIPWTPPGFLAIGLWAVIMGVTMYVQQKLNPPPPDPVQAKVFQFLPVLFVFLFATFPVGLVIYWTWNNLLTIGQQWVIMKRHGAFDDN